MTQLRDPDLQLNNYISRYNSKTLELETFVIYSISLTYISGLNITLCRERIIKIGIIFCLSSQIIFCLSLQILLSTIILFLVTLKTCFLTVEAAVEESLHPEHPTSALYATVDKKTLKKNNIDDAVNAERGLLHFVYKCMCLHVTSRYNNSLLIRTYIQIVDHQRQY